jgi:hypothetical protein
MKFRSLIPTLVTLSGLIFSLSATAHVTAISDIASMQLRSDGNYNVLCKNGTFEVVSSSDIAANNVCPNVPASAVIQNGTYKVAPGAGLCDQKLTGTYAAGVLQSLRLDYPSCAGQFLVAACNGLVCSGVSGSQTIRVTVIDSTHYNWENQTVLGSKGIFARIGNLRMRPRPQMRDPNFTGAAGTR